MEENKKNSSRNFVIGTVIFIVYAVLTFIAAINHELWFDEAQAWVIARDNDITGIFNVLKYEGHPSLWFIILHIFSLLGFSCKVLPLISWFFCTVAAALIVWKAPFGYVMKAAILFSGGMVYQMSIISRPYCLIPLLMCLIAMFYSKRDKYPICFGIFVALLANTHLCVSGLVGIIGIYMIIDLIKKWKQSSALLNIKRIIGLGIAGIGVLALVVPLITAMTSNSFVAETEYSVKSAVVTFFESFFEISECALYDGSSILLLSIISIFIVAAFVILLILLRHYPQALTAEIVFAIFFIIISNIIWYLLPARAFSFIYTFVFVFWAALEAAEPKQCNYTELPEGLSEFGKKLLVGLKKVDMDFKKVYCIVLTGVLLITAPYGCYLLFSDYTKDYCPSEMVADYISENLPPDSVIISLTDSEAVISAYLPDQKLYSLEYAEFYTYMSHVKQDEEPDKEKIYNDLKGYKHLYTVCSNSDADFQTTSTNIIYSVSQKIPKNTVLSGYVEISVFDLEKYVSQ